MNSDNILLRTYDHGEIKINSKDILEIYSNFIKVKSSKKTLFSSDENRIVEYQVYPEDMLKLLDQLKSSQHKNFNLRQVEIFLKKFPTKSLLDKSLKEDRNLPLE